jgi:hypothetical protein
MKYSGVVLSTTELEQINGGGSSHFWEGVGEVIGKISSAAADAGYFRAHKYGGKTKY